MTDEINVYQIGLGSFGRYGFEQLIELAKNYDEIKVNLEAVAEKHPSKLEKAEKFAEKNNIQIETFRETDKMYKHAVKNDPPVMIYDAGPSQKHARHLYKSLNHGFFHLTEKPPSLQRDQYLKEKRLTQEKQAMWKTDFIEKENPVVKKTKALLENEELEKIQIYRESSVGVQKILDPVKTSGVNGGDILDKMVHEIYLIDYLKQLKPRKDPVLALENAEAKYFMPKKPGSDKMLSMKGSRTSEIKKAATGQTKAVLESNNTEIELNSSWLGHSEETRLNAKKIKGKTGHNILNRKCKKTGEKAFINEESAYFVTKGTKNLVGDMLNQKLYNLETGEEIELPKLLHNQLYRVLKKAVKTAADETDETITDKEIDTFITKIFDIRDKAIENAGKYYEEIDKSTEKIESMIIEDKKILEPEEKQTLAG